MLIRNFLCLVYFKDLDVLYQQQAKALQDPISFVEKLQNKVECDVASFLIKKKRFSPMFTVPVNQWYIWGPEDTCAVCTDIYVLVIDSLVGKL